MLDVFFLILVTGIESELLDGYLEVRSDLISALKF